MDRDALEKLRRHFEERNETFLRSGFDRLAAARLVAEAGGALRGPALDVGTGKGTLATALARRGVDVVSVDVNAEDQALAALLAREEGLGDRITFLLRDAASLPFPSGHFGACAMMDVLHHLDRGAPVLSEMARVLGPGGTMVVAEFTPAGFDLVGRVHSAEGGVHPVGPVTAAWAEGFLEGLGLEQTGVVEGDLQRAAIFRKLSTGLPGAFAALDRRGMARALEAFAKSWLAHDGCWFLAAEERSGMEAAIALDSRSWERFAPLEAKRILEAHGIPEGGGLEALERALGLRMYAVLNAQRTEWSPSRDRLQFTMESCRVQEARRRRNLPDFPCRPVGEVEFAGFAGAVDPRIRVKCLHCPPDASGQGGCAWEFSLQGEGDDA